MKRATLVSTTSGYNLGLHKLGSWLEASGWIITHSREAITAPADLYCFSVIFSWDIPELIRQVRWVKGHGDIWIGGPACTFNAVLIEKATGIKPHVGPDRRFEEQPGKYKLLRTTRGCSGGFNGPCYACPVPRMDGTTLRTLSYSMPVTDGCGIVDDNMAQAPRGHQEQLVEDLKGYRSVDLNSGWEPWWWRDWMWDLWRGLPLVAWRTAFDGLYEEEHVERLIGFWRDRGVGRRRIWVYVLAGGAETFDQALYRAQKVVEWGGEPRIQPYKPNNWLKPRSEPYVQPDKGWSRERVVNLPRYFYGYHWRHRSFDEFMAQGRPRRAKPIAENISLPMNLP